MRIAVMGSGGLGGYFGARLALRDRGCDFFRHALPRLLQRFGGDGLHHAVQQLAGFHQVAV